MKPGLTTSKARSSFKPLYVFLKDCISNNKVLEQPGPRNFPEAIEDNFVFQILHPFPRITSTPKKKKTYPPYVILLY